ncbi:E3 ubiquitin-protein ligase MIB2-like [Diadema setosum]|uniref:E3 ubiquitin-protein ligase MIB2-like n=1 Tax=Diadema setosum TaxID=31175 RepID=UPI003B3AB9D2
MDVLDVGFRVIRGVDWIYRDQDGGPGHVGTIISTETGFRPSCPIYTRLVQWDVGSKGLYRAGHDGAFDLRILDSALAGKVHSRVWCDGCNKSEIQGLRWRCTECYGIDLCTDCYMGDKHDIRHEFMRVRCSEHSSLGPKMPPRCSSSFSPIYGFFPGAKVVKYPSRMQRVTSDTGSGKIVARTSDTETGQGCGQITLEFSDGVRSNVHSKRDDNLYVTAMCTLPAQDGEEIYETHFPHCGERDIVEIGDNVVLSASLDELRKLQQRRALPEINAENLGKVGVVTQRSEQGNFEINFTGSQQTVWINPFALRKLLSFHPGQTVLVHSDKDMVMRLQGDGGGNENEITEFLGKSGRVTKIVNGDIQVKFPEDKRLVFNASCLVPFQRPSFPGDEAARDRLADALGRMLQFSSDHNSQFVRAAMNGDTELVNRILDEEPDKVEYEDLAGKNLIWKVIPCDHATEMVKLLVDRGAFIDSKTGRTSLMRAVQYNKYEVVDYLLRHGANVNEVDGEGNSSLHMAVERGHFQCAHYLLLHGADVNITKTGGSQIEERGSTPLHYAAINPESRTIADMLTARKDTDFKAVTLKGPTMTNRGAVHFAARHDNIYAMQKLLERVPRLSTARTTRGETALHIAAQHNSLAVAKYLAQKASCSLNLRDEESGDTPLMIALENLHLHVVEDLLKNGASCNIENDEDFTSLFVALISSILREEEFTSDHERTPFVREMKEKWGGKGVTSTGDALIAYLVSHGADMDDLYNSKETFRDYFRRRDFPTLPALEAIERERSVRVKQSKSKQKSKSKKGNKKEKSSNPQTASETRATPRIQRARKVSDLPDLADMVLRARRMRMGTARKVRAEDDSPRARLARESSGASGRGKPATASADNTQPDGSAARDCEEIDDGGSDKEVDSLRRRDLRRFDHRPDGDEDIVRLRA